jgi:peroxiredoxin
MAQLRRDYDEIKKLDTEVIAVGPEDTKAFNDFWVPENMPFIGIPDPHHNIAKLFGQQVKLAKFGRLPAQFVIDREGLIRFQHFGSSMSDISEDKYVVEMLQTLNKET